MSPIPLIGAFPPQHHQKLAFYPTRAQGEGKLVASNFEQEFPRLSEL